MPPEFVLSLVDAGPVPLLRSGVQGSEIDRQIKMISAIIERLPLTTVGKD